MSEARVRARAALATTVLCLSMAPLLSCGHNDKPLLPRSQTWAELRTVRRSIKVTAPGEGERSPYPRERLVDGEVVHVGASGLAWLRRDGGATLLVQGPAEVTLRSDAIQVSQGRVFVDTPPGITTELVTPNGPLHLAHVRASIEVGGASGATEAYVLAGEVRTDGAAHAGAGERLRIEGKDGAQAKSLPALTWEDWTGGLATTDRVAEPAPFGLGTVGARRPGDEGAPRFPLAIQKLDVRVTIDHDFALTEVDETFFNPSSEVVEGIYRFRTPEGATLHRFGVDREGVVVWGRVKEKAAAAAQYQANVYQGSTEDPALLEWDAPGVYRARLYPIAPGQSRRVVVRYAEWLGRTGAKGERRLYIYPMAAEGAEESLPHLEELTATFDLSRAGAKELRTGMTGVLEKDTIVVRAQDLVPRADLAVELFDDGLGAPQGYTAPHVVDLDTLPPGDRNDALRRAKNEADYVVVPVRQTDAPAISPGIDLAIVVDTSAATEPATLAIARAATAALLAHLGKEDRAVVWAGDDSLRPVVANRAALGPVDDAMRRDVLTSLASIERGGATDLGAVLAQAAAALDPQKRGAVVYVGDGRPTVGELSLPDLRDRLAKLPRPVRIFGLGVGDGADMAILKGLARGAFAERIGDANGAARAALRLLELAERPAALGTTIDLGPSVERVYPRDIGAIVADESVVVVGRVNAGGLPTSLAITGPTGITRVPLTVVPLGDAGDLGRRWADGRLSQMLDEGTGRAAMVDLGSRHGIITPYTSLYVPTKNEMTGDELADLQRRKEQNKRPRLDVDGDEQARSERRKQKHGEDNETESAASVADNREGGTGTRAKGEEGSMGNPNTKSAGGRYGVQGPSDAPDPHVARAGALRDSAEFGMIGLLNTGAGGPAPVAAEPPAQAMARAQSGAADKAEAKIMAKPSPAPGGGDLPKSPGPARAAAASAPAATAALTPRTVEGSKGVGGDPNAPTAPWGRDDSAGNDALSARGNTWGGEIGDSFGQGGLGLSGIGEGGGGRSEGIGLGNVGTLGHGAGTGDGQGFGNGHGRLGGNHKSTPPQVRMGDTTVSSGLPPEVIQRIVRQSFGRFRLCYENGLRNNPNLQGRVVVRFTIASDGSVQNVGNGGSDMPDGSVVQCVIRAFDTLSFPSPEAKSVSVVFPIMFSPEGGDAGAAKAKTAPDDSKVSITLQSGEVPHFAIACSGAAAVPFEERIGLWRERLARATGNIWGVTAVYRAALRGCEAPTWRERAKLLSMMLDAMPSVSGRVALWRSLFRELGAADTLYRGILSRVRTPAEVRELHAALGLKSIDPGVLAKILKDAKTPGGRAKKLRELVAVWPDDFALALKLLDALEDERDDGGARELGRRLRARPDADARLRTAVGELYLRLSQRSADKDQKARDETEARRAFGEIVEFAPDDPVARRRLGDLLRAHGWYAEATRQYETLAKLAPDDASVPLLLAASAEGRGLLEEAVKWTEKGGAAGSPDATQGPARTARAFATTYLAWGRLAAQEAGRKEEAESLAARLSRVLAPDRANGAAKGTRISLVWSHPELHPTLWSNALGAPMPAPEGDVTMGIAQVILPGRDDAFVEVRIEADELEHAARLGATATLTVVFDETGAGEKIVKRTVKFGADGPAVQRFGVKGGEVRQ